MFGYRVPAPNEALLISGRKQRGTDALTVQDCDASRRVRRADLLSRLDADPGDARGRGGRGLLHSAGADAGRPGGHRVQGGRRPRVDRGGGQAVRRATSPRWRRGRPHLQRHLRSIIREHDRRGDHPRASRPIGDAILDASKMEIGPGSAWPSTRCRSAASTTRAPTTSRRWPRHTRRRSTRTPTWRRPPPTRRADGPAGERPVPGRVLPADRGRPGPVPGRDRPGRSSGPLRPVRWPRPRRSRPSWPRRALVAQKNAELREAELIAEVVKPAQAEAERITTLARAPGRRHEALRRAARPPRAGSRWTSSSSSSSRDLLRASAEGLQGANLTILNGAEGLSEWSPSLAGQGLAVLESVRRGLDHNAVDTPPEPQGG